MNINLNILILMIVLFLEMFFGPHLPPEMLKQSKLAGQEFR